MRQISIFSNHRQQLLLGLIIALATALLAVHPVQAATFTVDSPADQSDANPGNGVCATVTGVCTLRAAIQEANATTGADIITLPAGTYAIALTAGADDFAFGDFDISAPLTINGAGATATVLDAGGLDRVMEIHPPAGNVTLKGITLQNGDSAEDGGGIYNTSPGTLRLEQVTLRANATELEGGALHNAVGRVNLIGTAATPVVITGNRARSGGGLYNAGELSEVGLPARIDLTYATIVSNTATSGGGIAIDHEGVLNVTDATIAENLAEDHGGGISAGSRAAVTLTRVDFQGNRAVGDGGALFVAAERLLTIVDNHFTANEAGTSIPGELPGQVIEGDGGGGGLYVASSGPTSITGSTFAENRAVGDGGGILIESLGSVAVSDTIVRDNSTEANGGGIENAGSTVTFERLQIYDNTATLDGGGIENQGSGNFTIVDTNIYGNQAENGGGFANNSDGGLSISNTTFWNNRAIVGLSDDTGLGGGIYSLGDAGTTYENVTISSNLAQVRGGGLYIDADAGVRVINTTIAFNSAPVASGVGAEITSPNFPIYPSTSVIFRNTIVAANSGGPACNFALGSEGGNIEDADSCYFRGPNDRTFVPDIGLDAVADNGGETLTMALQPASYAIDGGVNPCLETDQRGVARPQNGKCDSGAFEYEGPFAPPDNTPPDTAYLTGPIQNTEATSLFTFTGSDNVTAAADLLFECRVIEFDPTEPPEPPDPNAPPDPALAFVSCPTPWQIPVIEEGTFTFEVRAIDRAGNVDQTPASHNFTIAIDTTPPNTFFLETPANPSFSNTATFTFGATDNATPPEFLEFECRIDSNAPTAWLECTNPAVFSNLTTGSHTVQVRATDGFDNIDPSPATYTWTVAPPANCEAANITLTAVEDSYVDEALPLDNFGLFESLLVNSAAPGADARTLLRFDLPTFLPTDCDLETATLRLYADGDPGRTLQAVGLDGAWAENQVTWQNQPAATGTPATTTSGAAYREWNVTAATVAMLTSGTSYGWLIRDAVEEDADGASQSFISTEAVTEPPTPPQLVLRFEDSGDGPPSPPPAPTPATLSCGQVITQSVLLQNDLLNCPGEGLVVNASNLIIDLDGHTIRSGLVIEPGEEDGLVAGIRNSGHSNVIIRNGTIRNFGFGVRLLAGARYNVVENMTLINNVNAGIELFDADDGRNGNIIRHNVLQLNGAGVQIINGSENSIVERNSFTGNVGVAIYMYDASGHRIANNTVTGLTGDPLLDSDGGFYLEGSSDNEIIGNTLADTGDAAILITAGSNRNRIANNSVTRASDSAIAIDDSDENEVIDNVTHLAGGAGIALGNANANLVRGNDVRFNPGGVELAGSSNNHIEDNDASSTGASGITVEGGTDNEIVNNVANHTGASGISVEAETLNGNGNPIGGFLIEGNETNHNLGDGISVGGSGHTIADNRAYHNLAFGIFAADGNNDGGGNRAGGNAEPVQCVGVNCIIDPGSDPTPPDLTPPDTTILTRPANGSSTLETATFTFTGSDNVAPATALRYECRLDAPPDPEPEPPEPGEPPQPPDVDNWLECASPHLYSFLLAGQHKFEVRARDPAANVDLTPATYTWTVVAAPPGNDPVPPNTTITAGPAGGAGGTTTSTAATFRFTGSDNSTPGPNLVFACSLDGAPPTICTSPLTLTGLSVAEHTFMVYARDAQGNIDPTPVTYTWTVDITPPDVIAPETTIGSGPELTTVNTSATFAFSSNEAGATFECALDDAPFALCAAPATLTGVAVGAHTFAVRAIDAAGNVDATPATYGWTVTPALVPTTVSCGQTLTQSTLVLNDLSGCLENGLIVGANGITIDLDGHAIGGTGLGAGILNNGFDSVTIKHGTVTGFDTGVQLGAGTALNLVEDLAIQLNLEFGVALINADDQGDGNIARNNTISGNGLGLALLNGTQGATILNNEIAASAGAGLVLEHADGNRVENNTIAAASDQGLLLTGSSDNTIRNNTIFGVSDAAFLIEAGSHDNLIEGNQVSESEAGIVVDSSNRNTLIDNVVSGSSDNGITVESAHDNILRGNDLRFNTGGIELDGSTGNLLEANIASETDSTGIELGDGANENILRGNQANGNSASGIAIGGAATAGEGNLLENNTASGNAGDGISVDAVGHIITGNRAHNNGGWGIYAAQGGPTGVNIDGGGNRAFGNVELEQCYNILCDGGEGLPTDTTPPETLLTTTPSDPSSFTSATFHFTGFDNASAVTFQCRRDGAAFAPCTSPLTYTGLALGEHSFAVRAIDYKGNIDPTPATFTWTIEAPPTGVAPETTITTGPDVSTASTSASFSFDADEEEVTFACALDGAAFTACTSPQSYSGLATGSHTFAVRATDDEGNPDATPATYSWTIVPTTVPAAVSCGQLLTQSTLVQNDLLDCNGNGLVVGANNITIDLNGHTIDGINLGVGILNNGFDGVTISNGVIQEFDFGVQLNGGTAQNVVADLTILANQEGGIVLTNADQGGNGNTIRDNTIDGSINGIALLDGTTAATIRGNTISASAGSGIYLFGADGNRLEANDISASSEAGITLEDAANNTLLTNILTGNAGGGIALGADLLPADNNQVEGNTITDSGSDGISVYASTGNELINNIVRLSGGDGISLEAAQDTLLRNNDIRSNAGGIGLIGSTNNRIAANNLSANSSAGLALEGLSLNNVIVGNTVTNNSDGIYVADQAASGLGNRIEGNTANGNGGDGIFVGPGGHTVINNTADSNEGWGIYAEQGTIDGGNNRATGNVEPAQCFNIACIIGIPPGSPDTLIVLKPTDPTNSRSALFTFTGADNITPVANLGFECRLDSTDPLAWIECENPAEYTGLTPGEHIFEVRAVDESELVDPTPAIYTWTITALPTGVAPDTFIDLAPPLDSLLLEGIFTFSANEPDVTFACALDGAAFAPCAFAFEFAFEEHEIGQHTFAVRATDFEGNTDPTPATYTWHIGGLITTITAGPAFIPGEFPDPAEGGETTETSATFEFAANIADSTFFCSLDLGPFVACDSPLTYTGLAIGEHLFQVNAVDPEGREQLEPTEYSWTIIPGLDTTPPNTILESGAVDATGAMTFVFSGVDNVTSPQGLTFECSLDDPTAAAFTACTTPWTLPNLEFPDPITAGPHIFYVRALDAEDNVDATPASFAFTYAGDTIAPVATILTGPPTATIALESTFTFAVNDPFAGFECALNGEPFEPCETPYETQVEPGAQTLQLRAIDLAGNIGPAATYTWTVIGPPVTTILSGPLPVSTVTTATFTFVADQSGATFACALNGGTFSPCVSPLELTGLGNGSYELAIAATNSYGLVEEEPVLYTWSVEAGPDTTAPQTTIGSGPPLLDAPINATFTFAANELGATFVCQLDGLGFSSCESPVSYTDLVGGLHEFQVVATDLAGNVDPTPAVYTWTVDGPPVTTITSGPEATTESTSATLVFSTMLPGSTFACSLDGAAFVACTSPLSYTDLAVGVHTFEVYATSPTGQIELDTVEYEWEIVAPIVLDTTFISGPEAATESTTATFAFTANIAGSTFACALDSESFTLCTSPTAVTDLTPGPHTFAVRATSPTNVVEAQPTVYSWFVIAQDTTAPMTTITAGPALTTTSTSASFTFVANETATFACSFDGEPFSSCTSPVELTDVTTGTHTFAIQATDTAGNTETPPVVHTWTVEATPPDTVAPQTTITAGPSGLNGNVDVVFAFTGSDNVTPALDLEFECALDGEPFASCASPYEIADLTVGEHTFQVRAVDEALNVDATPAERTWTLVDLLAPETEIDTGPEDPTTSTVATFTFTADEPDATFECALDGADYGVCTSPAVYSGLTVGPHTFSVRALDAAGNPDPTPATYAWTIVAAAAPDTVIVTAPSDPTEIQTAIFVFASVPAGLIDFECAVDGGPFVECPAAHEIEGLALGEHSLLVRAVDAVGVVDPTPASHTWTIVDTIAPDTTIESGPSATTSEPMATFAFESNELNVTFACALDGGAYAACVSPYTLTGVTPGPHTLLVRAVDWAANVDPTPASYSWTLEAPADTTPPETTIDSGPPIATVSTAATFTFSSDDPAATFACALDSTTSFSSCVAPATFVDLNIGAHTLLVRARDGAGNIDPTPASFTWTILPPPQTTILSGPDAQTESTSATFTFSSDLAGAVFACALDEAPFAPCVSGVTYTDLAFGEHEFMVQASDAASNVDPTPASFTWEIGDITPPVVTIVSGPPATTLTTTAVFAFTVDDPTATVLCALDGAAPTLCLSPRTFTGLAVGEHTLELYATTPTLIVDPLVVEYLWSISENTPVGANVVVALPMPTAVETLTSSPPLPETALQLGALYYDVNTTADFTGDVTICLGYAPAAFADPNTLQLLHYENGAWSDATTTNDTVNGLICGVVTSLSPFALALPNLPPPDTTAPETTIDSGPAVTTTATTATFVFTANEAGATFACAVDGGAFAPCTSPVMLAGVAVGTHTFVVQATDAAGNSDATPATYTWSVAPVDTTPPDTILDSVPPANTQSTSANFTFSATEAGASFACALDGGAFAPCTSPHTVNGLTVGAHSFAVRATDAAGNVDPTPATFTWTVQTAVACTVSTVVYAVTADAWLEQNSPSNSKGSDSILKIKSQGASDNFRAVVNFALPASVPNGCEILSATLRLYSPSATDERTLEALRLGGSWAENNVTWGNQPATVGAAATTTAAQGYREWDVTAQVQEGYGAGAHYGFLIRDGAENGGGAEQQFHSREKGETPPELVIRYTPTTVNDTTAPETSLESWPDATTYATSATFAFAANEAGVTFECRLDGGPYQPCISPKEYNGLSTGAHTFTVRAIDPAGNYDASPATYPWTVVVDTSPPVVTISSGPAATTSDTTAAFAFAANESGVSFSCALDGGAFAPCTSPANYNGLAVGEHTFAVRASDALGNTSTPVAYTWMVVTPPDTTAPVVTISTGPGETTAETSASFTFTANEQSVTFVCSVDGGALAACTSPTNVTDLALGAHAFAVQATDAAGNVSEPVTYSWTVTEPPDTTRPETTITDGPTDPSESNAASFSFTGSDNKSDAGALTFECALDTGAWSACSAPATYSALGDGPHTFAVRAVDEAGNRDNEPASYSWTVALPPAPPPPPATTINSGPDTSTTATSATFNFAADVTTATFECSWDNGEFASCMSPATQSGLALGEHTFSVRAVSSAGVSDPSPASYGWTIVEPPDTTAPETTITSQPEQPTDNTTATFSFTGSDNKTAAGALVFQCRLDGGAFAACDSPVSYSDLMVGSHTFAVRASDEAGNGDATPASVTWTIQPPPDTTAPETTISAGPAATTPSTSASFTFTANESAATFQCALDGAAFAPCISPKAYSGLSVGSHTFTVRATDLAGNVDGSPASYTWTIQAPAPNCTAATVTLTASADAWIDQNSASNNFGADSILKVQAKSGNNFRAVVRFPLPATPPVGCVVQSATLRLYAASWKTGRTLQAVRLNGTWAENAVTWNNQPAAIGTAATTTSGSNWRQWTVTSQVQAMFDLGANHGFLIRDANESGGGTEQQFHGREKGQHIPQLVIQYAPVPAVTGAMLTSDDAAPSAELHQTLPADGAVSTSLIFLPLITFDATGASLNASQPAVLPAAAAQTAPNRPSEERQTIFLPFVTGE